MVNISRYRNDVEFSALASLNEASKQVIAKDYEVFEFELPNGTKYFDNAYVSTKDAISKVNEKCLLLCCEKDMLLGNRLLWECDNLNGVIYGYR